jgi:hypothetical protein
MDAGLIERFETNVERIASASFAAAVAYAAYGLLGPAMPEPQPVAYAALGAVIAYWSSSRWLKAAGSRRPGFALSVFDVREIDALREADGLLLTDRLDDELLLTDADRLHDELVLTDSDRLSPPPADGEPLVLDDILKELGPDSRVVRLFDRKAMPTPGQLKSRIDDHLESAPPEIQSDAAQALSEALAELRRSLR